MANDDDFVYQLQQEQLERQQQQQSSTSNQSANIYRDPSDGTEYEWDPIKKAWFPRINDDFIAKYQASYGCQFNQEDQSIDKSQDQSTDKSDLTSKKEDETVLTKKRKTEEPQQPQWFEIDDEHNTNVYVSNLPLDITIEEFTNLMKKCGLIMKDDRGQLKIKLYQNEHGELKGDGRCCYIKSESVQLAINILDGYQIRSNHTIKVERAKFSQKGEYDPTRKPKKKKLNKKDREKQRKKMEKLFDWRPDKLPGERSKSEKTVVIKNMFDLQTFENDPRLIIEYKTDIRDECEQKCGTVKKIEIYDRNPDGVATVTFMEFDSADKCVELMNGRFFAGRKLDAGYWDGKQRYKIDETDEQIQKRIKKWDEFLENDNDNDNDKKNI